MSGCLVRNTSNNRIIWGVLSVWVCGFKHQEKEETALAVLHQRVKNSKGVV